MSECTDWSRMYVAANSGRDEAAGAAEKLSLLVGDMARTEKRMYALQRERDEAVGAANDLREENDELRRALATRLARAAADALEQMTAAELCAFVETETDDDAQPEVDARSDDDGHDARSTTEDEEPTYGQL